MIHQTGKVAQLIDALHRRDLEALGAAMEGDLVVEPARACLVPMLAEARAAAKEAGAIAVFIGGAGPTLCAVCDSASTAERAAAAMKAVYSQVALDCAARHVQVDLRGAKLLRAE